jgi:hypothetical protein
MASLDWSQCPAVESIPGKVSGAWVFKGTRTPVAVVFENLEDGMTVDEDFEVKEHAYPGAHQLLERIGRLDGLTTEPRLLHHHEHLKWRRRLQRVHEPQEAGPVGELRPGDPVILGDVRVIHDSAPADRVRAGVGFLAGDGLCLGGNVALIGGLAAMCHRLLNVALHLFRPCAQPV